MSIRFQSFGRIAAAAVFAATAFCSPQGRSGAEEPASETNATETPKEAVITLAGGCFWCTEAVYEQMHGVGDVVSGYIGGTMVNPDYKSVCTGQTGHAEAVEVYYDPSVTSYEELLEVFFQTHDPTTLNRQGHDSGTQYRSAIFYHDGVEKEHAEAFIKKLTEDRKFDAPIVTTLEPATKFYTAEEYHQDYFEKNPYAGYCRAVVQPKVRKFKLKFKDKVKPVEEK
jgi:peptide-methionine (S)-S-oxide reductase